MTETPRTQLPLRLDDLIDAVKKGYDDPLDQLASAVVASEALGEMADSLIGHFVDQARRTGASWSQIGQSMGVTKQAAQKRFVAKPREPEQSAPDPAGGFSQFTAEARQVVVGSQEEAHAAGHDHIRPAHLALGLLRQSDATATQVLTAQADADALRNALVATLPEPVAVVPALIPFDDGARRALEATFAHAQRLDAAQVGTEHVLLALLDDAAVADALATAGADPAAVDALLRTSAAR
ncbi:ATP-dependent Clp protease ATP-binding subunit [Mumia zhuanghuii]|uniref:Clp protease N-terminal domain-containing protein n=2 Tax=Mumia TaxID=1546255 RepID=A0ABW1QGY5_9ACTN|nr:MULTISPECIES: Clp protease N-terminal domain-containing protein [Mumia]KAA1425368.1 ATP-dependent Clp protease ATP-binding subunit [Mumia zhuanghuii]